MFYTDKCYYDSASISIYFEKKTIIFLLFTSIRVFLYNLIKRKMFDDNNLYNYIYA